MRVLITYKFKKDQTNINQEKVDTLFFQSSRAAYSVASSGIWPKFELVQTFMYVLITYKNKKDRIKTVEKM